MNPPVAHPSETSLPPFKLLGEHFTAALIWLILFAAALISIAPALAQGDFLNPRTLAVVHLLTLGVLTTLIFGTLYQFFPGALGIGCRSIRVAHATFAMLQSGTLLLTLGFWIWSPILQLIGWGVLFAAVGGMSWNLLPQRRKAPTGHEVGRYISLGHMALGLGMFLALARLLEPLGLPSVSRLGAIAAHFHLMAMGFITLQIAGVGSRMIPSFLAIQPTSQTPLRWVATSAMLGLPLQSVGLIWDIAALGFIGHLLVIAAALFLATQLILWIRHRTKGSGDIIAVWFSTAVGFLILAIIVGLDLLLPAGFQPRLWIVYAILALLGWSMSITMGVVHRLVPFLCWFNLFGGMNRSPKAPVMAELIQTKVAWATWSFWAGGTAALALGAWRGWVAVSWLGSVTIAAAVGLVVVQVVRAFAIWLRSRGDTAPEAAKRPSVRELDVLS